MKSRYCLSTLPWRALALGSCLGVGIVTGLAGCGDRSTDVEHIQRARAHQAKQEWSASVIELKNALQKNPENREARLLLGQIYVETGNAAPAEKELQRARDLGAGREAWLLPLARTYLMQGENKKVLALNPEPTDSPALQATLLALHGMAALGSGQPDAARTHLNRALELQADDLDALLGMSELALVNRNYSEAETLAGRAAERAPRDVRPWFTKLRLHRLQHDDPAALKAVQQILERQAQNASALLERAEILISQGKQEEAMADVEAVRRQQPRSLQANYLRGNLLFQKKDFTAAQEALLQVLKAEPEHPGSLFLLGSIHYEQGHNGQANEYLTTFVNRQPGYLPARLLLAATQLKLAKPRLAIDTLTPALAQAPEDGQLLALLGSAYLQAREYAKGSEYLQKAARIAPDAANIRTQLALAQLGEGKADDAVRELQGLVNLGQDVLQADLVLIQAYIQQKDYDKAIAAAEDLVKKKPDDPVARNLLGGAYLAKDNIDKARSAFEQALRLNPDLTTASLNLALLEQKGGNRSAAQGLYEKIVAKEPGNLGALLQLAGLANQVGQKEQTLRWLEQAWDKNPASLEAGLMLIGQYQAAGLNLKAANVARSLETANPDHPAAVRALGLALLADGQAAEAIKLFHKLAGLQPQAPEPWHLVGLAEARSSNFREATTAIDKALTVQGDYLPSLVARVELQAQQEKIPEALAGAKALQKQFPNLNIGDRLEGNLYIRQKDFTKALAAYRAAHTKAPDSQTVLMLAGALQVTGNSEGAIKTLRDWLAGHPEDAEVRARLAAELQRLGRREEAIAEYERLAKRPGPDGSGTDGATLDRGLQQADTLLVQAYLQQKDFDKALTAARSLTEKQPSAAGAFNLLGVVYLAKGEDAPARTAFEQAVKLNPDHLPALMNLATLDVRTGDRTGAQLRYRKILERNPDHLPAVLRLAILLGRTEESLRLLEQAWERQPTSVEAGLALAQEYTTRSDHNKAKATVKKLAEIQPNDPQVVRAMGLIQANSGDTANAVASFQKLATLVPQSPEPWYLAAMAQANTKDVKKVAELLDKAVGIQGNYLPALVARVQLQQQDQQFDSALTGIRNIQQLYPDQVTGHLLEGDLRLRQKEFDRAVTAYEGAYAKAPNGQTTTRLANAQWQAGKRESALATLQRWLSSEPKDRQARLQYAMYLQESNRKPETIAEYEKLSEQLPDNGLILNNLAWFYHETGDARALRYAERAHDKAPDNPEIADTLGWILVQRDEGLRGLEVLQKALAKAPDHPSIRYHLAVAYAKVGRKDSAREELAKLTGIPPFPEQQEARKLLESLGN